MNTYTAEEVFTVLDGTVVLTEAQAFWRLRMKVIAPTEAEGVYTVKNPFQLKRGESFGWDGVPSKVSRDFVRLVDTPPA